MPFTFRHVTKLLFVSTAWAASTGPAVGQDPCETTAPLLHHGLRGFLSPSPPTAVRNEEG